MNILVIGTGVIGTLTAITLASKNEIHHFVREEKFTALQNKRISYDILDERQPKKQQSTFGTYQFHCVDQTSLTEDYDLVIVAVNSYQIYPLLREIHPLLPTARFLLMALNWQGSTEIDALIPKEKYLMGYAGGGGTYRNDSRLLWGNIGDDILLGAVHDCQQPLLDQVTMLFQECGVKPEIPANILHALWLHSISTAPFGAALCKHQNLEQLIKDKPLIKTCFAAMQECYQVAARRGVNLKDFPETKLYKIPFFLLYPLFCRNMRGETAQRYTAHAANAQEEMQTCFEEILDSARQLAVPTPNMDLLHAHFTL